MKGVDTNILVRFLVGDDEFRAKKVYNIFKKAEANQEELFVPLPVILELVWVLESVYNIERKEIITSISDMLLLSILKFEHRSALQKFAYTAPKNSYDLSDLIIAHSAKEQGCETIMTFDRKASKYNLFELVK